ncbi:MAG: hypothetical protein R3B81_17580 [bacterium]
MNARIRRAVGLVLLISAWVVFTAAPGPARTLGLEDVIRLHSAGISDDIIMSEVIVTESTFPLTVDEILRLKELGFSDRLVKFLVDTTLDVDGTDIGEDPQYATDDPDYEDEGYGTLWENVIVEEAPTTTYFATLDWSYPVWYYDVYWWDYWYSGCGYSPYYTPWSWSIGAYYPGWYSVNWCWAPASWGWRWHHGYGYHHGSYYRGYGSCWNDYAYWNGYDHRYRGHDGRGGRGLSDYKVKTRSGGGTGKLVYADAGLKVRDVSRLTKTQVVTAGDRVKTKRVLAADTRNGRIDGKTKVPDHRPVRVGVKSSVPTRGTGDVGRLQPTRTDVPDRRKVSIRPTTRKPAAPDRPRVTRTPTRETTPPTEIGTPPPTREPRTGEVKEQPTRPTKPSRDRQVTPTRPAPKETPKVDSSPPKSKPKPSRPAQVQPKQPTPKSDTPRTEPAKPAPQSSRAEVRPRPSTPKSSADRGNSSRSGQRSGDSRRSNDGRKNKGR